MKILNTIFTFSLIIMLTACGASKKATTNSNSKVTTARSVTTATRAESSNSRTTSNSNRSNSEVSSTGAVKKDAMADERKKRQDMYSTLKMDDGQVKRFEKESKNYMATWKRENPNQEMNNFEKVEYRDGLMKSILNESQFKEYQQWALENADKN